MIEYWVRDKGNGYSDIVTEDGTLIDCDNEVLVLSLVEFAGQLGNVVYMPDRPLSRAPTFWQRMVFWWRGAGCTSAG